MPRSSWITKQIGPYEFELINLGNRAVERDIQADIRQKTKVTYDRRWTETERFCNILLAQQDLFKDRSVLILGAGIGMDTLIYGRLCKQLYLNDLSTTALDLCTRQLDQNGIDHYEVLQGSFTDLDLPEVDLVSGCYLVDDENAAEAIVTFLKKYPYPTLIMNGRLPAFDIVLKTMADARSVRTLMDHPEDGICLLFT